MLKLNGLEKNEGVMAWRCPSVRKQSSRFHDILNDHALTVMFLYPNSGVSGSSADVQACGTFASSLNIRTL